MLLLQCSNSQQDHRRLKLFIQSSLYKVKELFMCLMETCEIQHFQTVLITTTIKTTFLPLCLSHMEQLPQYLSNLKENK